MTRNKPVFSIYIAVLLTYVFLYCVPQSQVFRLRGEFRQGLVSRMGSKVSPPMENGPI